MQSASKHSSCNPSHWFACFGKKNKPKPIDRISLSAPIHELSPKGNLQTDVFDIHPQIQTSPEASACLSNIIVLAQNERDSELLALLSTWKNHPEFSIILLKSHSNPGDPIFWSIRENIGRFIEQELDKGNDALLHRILDDLSKTNIPMEKLQPLLDTLSNSIVRSTDSSQARWEWSQAFDKLEQKRPIHKIEDFSKDMMKKKQTSRPLNAYQERLKIPSAALENLHKQRLCLVGGGYSRIKQDLREQGVKCNVTNIDPICTQHYPENEDTKLPLNFCEPGILKT